MTKKEILYLGFHCWPTDSHSNYQVIYNISSHSSQSYFKLHLLFYRGVYSSILLDYSLSLQYKVCLSEGEETDNLLYNLITLCQVKTLALCHQCNQNNRRQKQAGGVSILFCTECIHYFPLKGISTGCRHRLAGTSWSLAKANASFHTWNGITPCKSKDLELTD